MNWHVCKDGQSRRFVTVKVLLSANDIKVGRRIAGLEKVTFSKWLRSTCEGMIDNQVREFDPRDYENRVIPFPAPSPR